MLDRTEQHEMCLDRTYSSGAEEWYCPTCGRRILLGLPANGGMAVIDPGDTYARHFGSHGGLRIGAVQVAQRDAEPGEVPEESLLLWSKALADLDLGE